MIPELRGTGSLLLGDDEILAGAFNITHDLNQSNGLVVQFNASGAAVTSFESRINTTEGPQIERNLALRGTTRHGQPVHIGKLLVGNRNLSRKVGEWPHLALTLLPRDILLVGAEGVAVSGVRCFIPNVRFGGMVRARGSRRDTVLVDLEHSGRAIRICLRQLPGYEEAIESLERSTSSVWTAKLDVSALDGIGFDIGEAIAVADDFLLLLSFALSRRVMWVSLKTMHPGITHREVRYGTAMNLKAFPGSAMGDGALTLGARRVAEHPLSEFLAAALPAYWALERKEREALEAAIRLLCESIQHFFSPAAVTLVGRAFETLCSRFLSKSERDYLSGDSQPERDLKAQLASELSKFARSWASLDKPSSEEWAARLDGHVSNALRRAFKLQLCSLLDRWLTMTGNTYEPAWVNQFVNARNSAAHSGPIKEKEFDAWVKGATLLSRVVLKILGYAGPYVDFWGRGERASEWSTLR